MEVLRATQGKITGVIIPPPEIRAVVDRTASYVAKIGKSFEQRVLASEEGKTAKFNFMKPFDPYHAYYEMKIRESEEGKALTSAAEETKSSEAVTTTNANAAEQATEKAKSAPVSVATTVKASIVNPIAQLAQTKPTEGPAELEFSVAQTHPAGLTPLDIDVIKLSAQYTAVNGREFLANLALREQRNPQFDFLKPTHVLFSYFTYLVDCYAKIAHPSAALKANLQAKSKWDGAMESAVRRWQWTRAEAERRRSESTAGEDSAERLAFQAIDWFDFTVVETIDFPEDELLELPGLDAGVTAMDLANGSGGSHNGTSNGHAAVAVAPPPPAPAQRVGTTATAGGNTVVSTGSSYYAPAPAQYEAAVEMDVEGGSSYNNNNSSVGEEEDMSDLRVVSDYQHHSALGSRAGSASRAGESAGPGLMMVDPISGKAIPVDQLTEHMRVQLLDPRWREQQQRFLDKQKETGYAEGGSIADSLKMFARKRGDIFGQAASGAGPNTAAAIAEQEALEQRKAEIQSQVQWDGHYGTIGTVQQLKHELQHKAPAAFQLPIGSVKQAPSIGPSSSAPVVAHYSLPAAPVHAPAAASIPANAISLPTITLTAASAAPPPPPPVPVSMPMMGMGAGNMMPPPPPPLPFGAPIAPIIGGQGAPPPPLMFPPSAGADLSGLSQSEPASKKAKMAEVADVQQQPELMPAAEFSARFPQPVTLQVLLPSDPSAPAAWNLTGGSVSVAMPVMHTVKQLKELLSTQLGGMPTSKQQLKHSVFGFLKDANSLAELNLGDGSTVELSVKSRGGKR